MTTFSTEVNGRKFVVIWKIQNWSSPTPTTQDFTIKDSCFSLEYSFTGSKFSLKLFKKQPTPVLELSKAIANLNFSTSNSLKLQPRKILVAKDGSEAQLMSKISNNHWEYHHQAISFSSPAVNVAPFSFGASSVTVNPAASLSAELGHSNSSSKPVHFRVAVDCEPLMKDGEFDLINHLGQLLYSGTDSDIQFIVKGEKIPGHKLILRGSSPVLAAMFEHDMTEKASGTIEIKDVEPKVFRPLLHYLYTGDAPEVDENGMTEPLFIAADKYQIESLKSWCSSILSKTLSVENTIHFFVLAHLHSSKKLEEDCIEFIAKNKAAFWEMDEFEKLCESYPSLFYQATKRMNKP